jgi:DNA-binding CsgD family transcriptional regulator
VGLTEAVALVLDAGLPSTPFAPRWAVDTIAAAGSDGIGRVPPRQAAAFVCALAWVLLRAGRASAALQLCERNALPLLARAAVRTPALEQSLCHSVIAEVFLLTGRLPDAAAAARTALEYADEDDAHRFRALGVLAAALAMNGEFTTAAGVFGSACELDKGRGWSSASWPLALAGIQIGFRTGDADDLQQLTEALEASGDPDVVSRAVARFGSGGVHSLQGDHQDVVAILEGITHGVDRKLCPPFLLDLALTSEAMALVHIGDPGAALRLINGRGSSPGHVVCFELQRAGIHIQLGDPRAALAVTEVCVRDVPDHSLQTLPSVLLRRAVAHEMLGHEDQADAMFSRSAHLAAQFAGMRPAMGLPPEILERLYRRLLVNEPGFRKTLTERIPENGTYDESPPLGFDVSELSERERVLAGWLATGLTLAQIAGRLTVSVNTVKTQTSSLYRKLGVTRRRDAIHKIELTGLFTDPTRHD